MRRRLVLATWVTVVVLGMAAACGSSDSEVSSGPPDTAPMARCGGSPFPLSALDAPAGAEHGTDPPDRALAAWLDHQDPPIDAPLTGWRRVRLDDDQAEYTTFSRDTATDGSSASLTFERKGDTWRWAGSSGCGALSITLPGTAETRWALDPDFPPPGPADTSVHVRVSRLDCNDGRRVTPEEVHPPVITTTADQVAVWYVSDPVSPGMHTCPGPMGTPLVLDLGEPLGPRTLVDGGSYPAQPVTSTQMP